MTPRNDVNSPRVPSGLPGWTAGLATLAVLMPADAWAYVDPGAGSYVFQLAAAALLAGTYLVRHWSSRALGWCGRVAGRAGGRSARSSPAPIEPDAAE